MADAFWVGTYTADQGGSAEGILRVERARDGVLTFARTAATTASPSYLVADGAALYAVGEGDGTVAEFTIADGRLQFASRQPVAGPYPCHLSVAPGIIIAASYGDGTLTVLPIDQSPHSLGGRLGAATQAVRATGGGPRPQQESAHAHSTLVMGDVVLSADLGADRVLVHSLVDGELVRITEVVMPAGSGPRDLVLHPSGRVLVLAELSCEVYTLERSSLGWVIVASTTLAGAEPFDQAAAIAPTADARFAFVGLRGSDRISRVAIAADATPVGDGWVSSLGRHPRHLVVTDAELLVSNQHSNQIVRFGIDESGALTHLQSLDVPSPTFVLNA